jgi:hypothetical protein
MLTFTLCEEWKFAAQIVQKNLRIQTIRNILQKLPRECFRKHAENI